MFRSHKRFWIPAVTAFAVVFLTVVYALIWSVIPDRGVARSPLIFGLLALPYLLVLLGFAMESYELNSVSLRVLATIVLIIGAIELAIVLQEFLPLLTGNRLVPAMFGWTFLVAYILVFLQIPIASVCLLIGCASLAKSDGRI